MLASLLICFISYTQATVVTINTQRLLNTVDERFISYTLDSSSFASPTSSWRTLNHSSPLLLTLMKGIGPSILRVGGSLSDTLVFNKNEDVLRNTKVTPTLISATKDDLDTLVILTRATGARLLWDLDLQLRYGTQWDPTDALELMQYLVSKGYGENIDFELGNEPNYYNKAGQSVLKPDQIGDSFLTAKQLIDTFPTLKKDSRLVGPDVVGHTRTNLGAEIIKAVANKAGHLMDAITFHHYYFRGDTTSWEEYINPKHFPNLEVTINDAAFLVRNSSNPNLPLWIGETSDSWHGGTPNVSDRYVSSFLWLEKLGLCASMGVDVVMRQVFYDGNYGIINDDFTPRTDYWVTLLHKTLCDTRVLGINYIYKPETTTRIYSHCTSNLSGYPKGAVTVFVLNVNQTETDLINIENKFGQVDVYLLTPGEGTTLEERMTSKTISVNGEVLKMVDNTTFPTVSPKRLTNGQDIPLPPLSMAYFVFPNADVGICK